VSMGLLDSIRKLFNAQEPPPAPFEPDTRPEYIYRWGQSTIAGKRVSAETAKSIATAYRCGNIISDDIASLPFQVFQRIGRQIIQVQPDPVMRNTAYLIEIEPNRWMTPFVFKKTVVLWLLYYGNAYIWEPAGPYREWYILDADRTTPGFDQDGNKWYRTQFPNGDIQDLPSVEVLHLMINSTDGLSGKSVLTYARETLGRQLGAKDTQNRIHSQGLNPTAALYIAGEANSEARQKVRDAYLAAVRGSENTGGVAVFDNKVTKFETISISPADAQFLETIQATDAEIANFFGLPLHKLNMGKQSYESNIQQQLDYLSTTLNSYLVQWEQAARLRWLRQEEQGYTYLRFIRDALLRTNPETRSKYLKDKILSGQLSPNEARQIEDLSPYEGGDAYYIPSNMARVLTDGSLEYGDQSKEANRETQNE